MNYAELSERNQPAQAGFRPTVLANWHTLTETQACTTSSKEDVMLNVQSGRDARQRSMSHLGSRASGWRKHRTTGAEATAAAAHAAALISALAPPLTSRRSRLAL